MSSSNSPCAACKFLRRKCTQGCVFAPYFPADQPQRFANVHRVFGASNVAKLLNELSPVQREDTVNSLAYEADMRLRDPVYGCVGYIFILQHKLRQIQYELEAARKELAAYIGPAALGGHNNPFAPAVSPFYHHQLQQQQQQHGYLAPTAASGPVQAYGMHGMGLGLSAAPTQMLLTNQPQQQQQQQLVAVQTAREQEMMRSFEQDLFGGGGGGAGNSGLALVSPSQSYDDTNAAFQVQQQPQPQPLQIQYPEHPQSAGSNEKRSHAGDGSASS